MGELVLVNFENLKKITIAGRLTAHEPVDGPQDLRFGQLGKHAEIWNLCWSPCEKRLATCSEDQSVRLWKVNPGTEIAVEHLTTLQGHTLAVTCVDWRCRSDESEVLVSCSDDQTVRVYNGQSYQFLFGLNTHHLYGWHTITYLSLMRDASQLVCTTQHGYLVCWQLAGLLSLLFFSLIFQR
jgi:WD40 repeat protein